MADYNTFVMCNTKSGKPVLVTSSARKVKGWIRPGLRIEVWNNNRKVDTVYSRTVAKMSPYIEEEKAHIGNKQRKAEKRNFARNQRKLYNESVRDDFEFYESLMR